MSETTMTVQQEMLKAMEEAVDFETTTYWWKNLSSLIPLDYKYVNGEPRRYYKNKGGRYYYRRVAEVEMYRRT